MFSVVRYIKKGEGQIGSEKYPYLWSEENS